MILSVIPPMPALAQGTILILSFRYHQVGHHVKQRGKYSWLPILVFAHIWGTQKESNSVSCLVYLKMHNSFGDPGSTGDGKYLNSLPAACSTVRCIQMRDAKSTHVEHQTSLRRRIWASSALGFWFCSERKESQSPSGGFPGPTYLGSAFLLAMTTNLQAITFIPPPEIRDPFQYHHFFPCDWVN